jgi:uncharacterized membrane protein YccC
MPSLPKRPFPFDWRRVVALFPPATAERRRLVMRSLRHALRCVLGACVAYWLALLLHLPNPVWAPMSALIVSQETPDATRKSMYGRFNGTVFGVAIALAAYAVGMYVPVFSTMWQMAAAVALCAICVRGRPAMRVCLWTVPLVLLDNDPGGSDLMTGTFRALNVILGALVGGVFHNTEDAIVHRITCRIRRFLRTMLVASGRATQHRAG